MAKAITLQTKGINVEVKERAEEVARDSGFNSIHDVIRLFVQDLARGRFSLNINWGDGLDPEVQEALQEHERGETEAISSDADIDQVLSA